MNWLNQAFGPNTWFGPAGQLVTPIVLLAIAVFVTWRLDRKNRDRDATLKRIESTLEFSKRFQELIRDRRALNRKFMDAHEGNADAPPTAAEKEEGRDWWWGFFDLVLFEFDFFQSGLVRKERFIEWMRWRWYDSHPEKTGRVWKTNGVSYQDGWKWWRSQSAHENNRLIAFLEEIHEADEPESVPGIVANHARRPGQETALDAEARRQ